ncbi:hypothetical protein TTHERM_00065700 (macronuclear) [Tetrahymena thermophila SB210]|uniref:Uncharacterized protein n=1 Tax=Tetrahymena thermophila (strain SB210) TaxID=312017 RepID=I7MDF0_TETTS|nr:hypothetical protein TTHERM_00065700 [Tetrahymena thermophila SB210]EAR87463.2 hypothetical protein TTHERM_00065700 [Tetrahymena thermophila SB210]|eukprot:XP_001007708.2 hypothetical protein TTHERM_00065700 [Tetrahymena thermophila SB210]
MNHTPIVGIDLDKWAIPYEIKLQPCLLENHYGICAQIGLVNDNNMYILVDKKQRFQLSTVSKQFYQLILAELIPQDKISQISLSTLIPCFPFIFEKFKQNININKEDQMMDSEFSTILFKPKSYDQLIKLQNEAYDYQTLFNFQYFQIFLVKGDILYVNNQHIEIIQIKVKEIVQFLDESQKIEQLYYFQKQMELNKTQFSKNFIENQILNELSENNNYYYYGNIESSQNSQEAFKEVHICKQLEFQYSYETGALLSPQLIQKISTNEEKILNEALSQENIIDSQRNFNLPQSNNQLKKKLIMEKNNQSHTFNQVIYSARVPLNSIVKYPQVQKVELLSESNIVDTVKNKQFGLNSIHKLVKPFDANNQIISSKSEKQTNFISQNQQKQETKMATSIRSSQSSQISSKQNYQLKK